MSPWQLIGIVSLSLVILFGITVLLRSPTKGIDTISFHIASKRHYFIIAALLLTLAGGAFYCFLIFWLLPTYQLPAATYYIIISAFVGQLLVAWVPAKVDDTAQSLPYRLHTLGGIWVGTSMILCMWILALFGRRVAPISYVAGAITAAIGTLSYITLLIGLWRYKKLVLWSEITMIGLFFVTLTLLALQI